MSKDDDIYLAEKEQQEKAGMCACRCSNCEPEASRQLALRMKWITNNNFDAGLQDPISLPNSKSARIVLEACDDASNQIDLDAPIINQKRNVPPPRKAELNQLAKQLSGIIFLHHKELMGDSDRLRASAYLDENDIWRVLDKIHTIKTENDVYGILGCDILPGGVAKLFIHIQDWKMGTNGSEALAAIRAREAETRVMQAITLARLTKQHEEREARLKEARDLTEKKRRQSKLDNLAEVEAKRQRKENKDAKKKAADRLKAEKEAQRVVNLRMLTSLKTGQTMSA
ncbi:uncharacterized protein MELLADRAFT_60596 [Melampsora larici-populina 98AG31]|uniref:Uncharacterized protein n=1 Tax=Melampsora larici-populina (strain 98AG31 / pathotype 3-4-7) TaxID=747676 RepID=F4RBN2_MELLP|nr:uncharacterized protein MELLADRAFT_60596 [Melampsora larici-populina 98AG31]EGG10129.1 hypothetical protein MELLADRAFT_60596 [Melampsora larici-populina 98AG31]